MMAAESRKLAHPPKPAPRKHKMDSLFCRKPLLCDHCSDFIWGLGEVGVFCRNCKCAYHSGCVPFAKGACARERKSTSGGYDEQASPLSSWTKDNVLNWLCVIGTYRYVAVFRSNSIDGEQLATLTEDRLAECGIAEKAQRRAIVVAINYLVERVRIPRVTNSTRKSAEENEEHAFVERSFGYCEKCDVCELVLLGLTRQGLQCKLCGLRAHRSCARAGPPLCQYAVSPEPIAPAISPFETELQDQFDPQAEPAPYILVVCCEEVEYRIAQRPEEHLKKALVDVYRKSASHEDVQALESAIMTLQSQASRSGAQWQRVAEKTPREALRRFEEAFVFGGVVKKYLRYLPDSLIPVAYYQRLLETAADECQSTATRLRQVNSMLADLPSHSKVTLRYVMQHFVRLANMLDRRNPASAVHESDHDLVKSYLPVFNQIIIRPPWHCITDMIDRENSFTMIVEALMRGCDWGIELPRSCRFKDLGSGTGGVEERLEDYDWYWGAVSRNVVADTMQEQPDGSFLVRDSISCSSDGLSAKEYTLTLRKGQKDTLIKIYCRNGKYGFAEATLFDSVAALINHHRTNSLASYNPEMDITLMYPVSRKHFLVDYSNLLKSELQDRLKEVTARIIRKEKEAAELEELISFTSQQIEMHQSAINAFSQVMQLLYDQNKATLNAKRQQLNSVRDSAHINRFIEMYDKRLVELSTERKKPESTVAQLESENSSRTTKLAQLKTQLKRLSRKRDQIAEVLLRRSSAADIESVINAELERNDDSSDFRSRSMAPNDTLDEASFGEATPPRSNSISGLSSSASRSTLSQFGVVPHENFRKTSTPAPSEQQVPWTPNQSVQSPVAVTPTLLHGDRSTWYKQCTRADAERILAPRRDGTFLVRPSSSNEQPGFKVYSLSIKFTDVKHCLIFETSNGACGFKPEACTASNLVEFISHYAVHSLRECNPDLDVALMYPAFARSVAQDEEEDVDADYTEMTFGR